MYNAYSNGHVFFFISCAIVCTFLASRLTTMRLLVYSYMHKRMTIQDVPIKQCVGSRLSYLSFLQDKLSLFLQR